jgi:hypothetical protein
MNKTIFLSLALLLSISLVSAYVPIENHNGVRFKVYDHSVNATQCYEIVERIPKEYLTGNLVIRIQREHRKYLGFYYWGGTLDMYGNCEEGVLIHELAHHRQYIKGDTLYELSTHGGRFEEFESEILNATR